MTYRILLIDGDPSSTERLQGSLTGAGYDVTHVGPGYEALDAFLRLQPHLALLQATPAEVGICQQLKQTEVGRQTPIVLFREGSLSEAERDSMRGACGCDAVIASPQIDEAVLSTCRSMLANATARTTEEAPALKELEQALERLGGGSHSLPPVPEVDEAVESLLGASWKAAPQPAEQDINSRVDSLLGSGPTGTAVAAPPVVDPRRESPAVVIERTAEPAAAPEPKPDVPPVAAAPTTLRAKPAPEPKPVAAAKSHTKEPAPKEPSPAAATKPHPLVEAAAPAATKPYPVAAPPAAPEPAAATPKRRVHIPLEDTRSAALPIPEAPPAVVAKKAAAVEMTPEAPRLPAAAAGTTGTPFVVPREWRFPQPPMREETPSASMRYRWAFAAVVVLVLGAGAWFVHDRLDSGGSVDPHPRARIQRPKPPAATASAPAPQESSNPPATEVAPAAGAQEAQATQPQPATKPPVKEAASPTIAQDTHAARPQPATKPPVKEAASPAIAQDTHAAKPQPATKPPVKEAASPAIAQDTHAARPQPATKPPVAQDVPRAPTETAATPPPPAAEPPAETTAPSAPETHAAAAPTPPRVIERVVPTISHKAQKDGGTIVLKVLVNERGKIARVLVDKGIPGSEQEAAAISAVLRWNYEPATENGLPVKAWTTETFVFGQQN
ncbi:MAG TPA: TonB family protein [Candidatus Polarisedimenticolaceae bacterium]|nr:TonB family protein [Candidatus Polarisedimenticolaceae bacterium]